MAKFKSVIVACLLILMSVLFVACGQSQIESISFKEKDIYIDFLLGFQYNSWKLWIGKIGAISYDDDPWCDFRTSSFKKAILAALDKVVEFIDDVEEDQQNWVQFYKKL